jgi:hypothetical protein
MNILNSPEVSRAVFVTSIRELPPNYILLHAKPPESFQQTTPGNQNEKEAIKSVPIIAYYEK